MKYLIFIVFIILTSCNYAVAQNVEITIEDLRKFRQAVVDAEFYKKKSAELETQKANWEISSNNWQKLYNAEKVRADEVQGAAIKACEESNTALGRANLQLHIQAKEDRQKIGELEFDNRKLRSSRKWYFAGGLVVGAAAGGYVGHKTGKR